MRSGSCRSAPRSSSRASSPRGTESLRTLRWRKMDSNNRSRRERDGVEERPAANHRRLARRPVLNDPRPAYRSGRQQPRDPFRKERDRWFESGSLQRRVRCEPISPAGGAERQAAFGIISTRTCSGSTDPMVINGSPSWPGSGDGIVTVPTGGRPAGAAAVAEPADPSLRRRTRRHHNPRAGRPSLRGAGW
jgi:hypothetical protein